MKTSGLFLIFGILLPISLSAQKPLKLKSDSIKITKDSLFVRQFDNQLKLQNPYSKERPTGVLPYQWQFKTNPNLAMTPNSGNFFFREQKTGMPTLSTKQSDMSLLI